MAKPHVQRADNLKEAVVQVGARVHIPAPERSNHQWSVYNVGTITAVDGDQLNVRLQGDPARVVTVQRSDVLTDPEFFAYLMTAKNGPA